MSELMTRVLENKQKGREDLANLPFEEKIALIEKMKERGMAIAASPLRKQFQNLIPKAAAAVIVIATSAGEIEISAQIPGLTPPARRLPQDQPDTHQIWQISAAESK
jgi:hypothetical protein